MANGIVCIIYPFYRMTESHVRSKTLKQIADDIKKDVLNMVSYIDTIPSHLNFPDIPLLNLTTLEEEKFCIAITTLGLLIVGQDHNKVEGLSVLKSDIVGKEQKIMPQGSLNNSDAAFFESIYSLLDSISPAYRSAFCGELCSKLLQFQGDQYEVA